MKLKNIILFSLVLIFNLFVATHSHATPTLQPATVLQTQTSDYGKKYQYLVELHDLVSQSKLPDVVVPLPVGLNNQTVSHFLDTAAPQVKVLWEQIAKQYQEADKTSSGAEFLAEPSVRSKLATIEEDIHNAFAKSGSQAALGIDAKMQDWMSHLAQKNAFLMVRSTGDEDGAIANAGGNLSVSYVAPNWTAALTAAGEVVASYFSEHSLLNRLNGGENPFERLPKLPVLFQELVGELPDGLGPVPVSLVLFTNDSEYVGEEKFRVMRLSATYGHGEGVVGDQGIRSDTILLVPSRVHPGTPFALYDNQPKPYRLAPRHRENDHQIKLRRVANARETVYKRTLSEQMLQRLYSLGLAVEQHYQGQPMDMEIVIVGDVIYPIQARPFKQHPTVTPSYLNPWDMKTNPDVEWTAQGKPLVSGALQVLLLTNPKGILFANTLDEAEKLFDKNVHKVVIVQQDAPANSHAVVNFRGLKVPCLYVQNMAEIQQAMGSLIDQTFAICIQTGRLYLLKGTMHDSLITEGYINHPAPLSPSIEGADIPFLIGAKAPLDMTPIHRILQELALAPKDQWPELLERLNGSFALWYFNHSVNSVGDLVKGSKGISANTIAKQTLGPELQQQIRRTNEELNLVLADPSTKRLELLFYLKVLQGYFEEDPATSSRAGHVSIQQVYGILKGIDEALAGWGAEGGRLIQLSDEIAIGHLSSSQALWTAWNQWLHLLEKSDQDLTPFKKMLLEIDEQQLLPLWVNYVFAPAFQQGQADEELMDRLVSNWNKSDRGHIEALTKEFESLSNVRLIITRAEDPAYFKMLNNRLYGTLEGLSMHSPAFQGVFESNLFVSMTAKKVMNEAIDVWDSAIKAVRGSPNDDYTMELKAENIQVLLKGFMTLLTNWSTGLSPWEEQGFLPEWPLQRILDHVRHQLNGITPSTNELESHGFQANKALIGHDFDPAENGPKTLEELFTWIHQNLLNLLSKVGGAVNDMLIDGTPLSGLPKDIVTLIPEIIPTAQRQTWAQTANGLVIDYNIPLRMHSATMKVWYDTTTHQARFEPQFIDISPREGAIGAAAELLNAAGLLKLIGQPNVTSRTGKGNVSFTWEATNRNQVEKGLQFVSQLIDYTFTFNNRNLTNNLLQEARERGSPDHVYAWALNFLDKGRSVHGGAGDIVGYTLLQLDNTSTQLGDLLDLPHLQPLWQLQSSVEVLLQEGGEQKINQFSLLMKKLLETPVLFRSPLIQKADASLLVPAIKAGLLVDEGVSAYHSWLSIPLDEDFAGGELLMALQAHYGTDNATFMRLVEEGLQSNDPVVRRSILKQLNESPLPSDITTPILKRFASDPSLSVRIVVLEGVSSLEKPATMGMELVNSLFQTPEDRELVMVFDGNHLYAIKDLSRNMLNTSTNDRLSEELWVGLIPVVADYPEVLSFLINYYIIDWSDTLVHATPERQQELVKLIKTISQRLEQHPHAQHQWNEIIQGVIDNLNKAPDTYQNIIDELHPTVDAKSDAA